MVSIRLQKLLSELGLTIGAVNMGIHTLHVSVTLVSETGDRHIGSVEKKTGKEMQALDLAVGEALSRDFPGAVALWYRFRGIEKIDSHGDVLETVC